MSSKSLDNATASNQKLRKKLNGQVFELKKECLKFNHFYLTYSDLTENNYDTDKKKYF